ncbi:MAG: hypothetical protein ABSA21_02805 [Candidatus Limnocylindrales bacterium]|jgi:hypothetical protein
MSATETQPASQPTLTDRIALVRAQLAPIGSRRALLDSYRRESLCRLASPDPNAGSAIEVLDIAYALRWAELAPEDPRPEPDEYP